MYSYYDLENDPNKKKLLWFTGDAYVKLTIIFSGTSADYMKIDGTGNNKNIITITYRKTFISTIIIL